MQDIGIKIVVLNRGWVIIAPVTKGLEEYRFGRGFLLRRWGTTQGLGELEDGPTTTTKLDPYPGGEAPIGAIIMTWDINQEVWRALIGNP